MYSMQPGDSITPGSQGPQLPRPDEPANQSNQEQQAAQPANAEATTPAPDKNSQPQQPDQAESGAGWTFSGGEAAEADQFASTLPVPTVKWTASEYVAHDKNPLWYVLVVLASVAIAGIVYLITRELVSPVVVVILGISFAFFGARRPQVLEFAVTNTGVQIGQKHYPFGMFRTFSIIEEDAVRSILLMPLQRFNLPISIYYDPADEQRIIEALSVHLPHEERDASPVDRFMRRIRF